MSPLLRSESRRPIWWVGLLDLRFAAGCVLLGVLIFADANPRAFADPQGSKASADDAASFPAWGDVEGALTDFFKREPNYKNGDLISRKQGERFLSVLPKFGWTLERGEQEKLLGKLLPEDHFLVQELRTPAGTKFMRQIAKLPEGYDRAQRLTGLKGGKERLKELVRGPDGYKLIEYMAKSDGGKNLGTMLGDVKGGRDFNKPTGVIYTESGLGEALKELHSRATVK